MQIASRLVLREVSLRDMFEGSMKTLVFMFADNSPAIRAKAVKVLAFLLQVLINSVCMDVCMYVLYVCIIMYVSIEVCSIYLCMYVCMYCVCMEVLIFGYIIYACMNACEYVSSEVCMYVCMYV